MTPTAHSKRNMFRFACLCHFERSWVSSIQLLLCLYNDKTRVSRSHPGSGHSNLRTLGWGQCTGDSLRTSTLSSLQKNSENTHGYISRPSVSLGILTSLLGQGWTREAGGAGGGTVELTSLFSCPQHDLLRSLSLPACPHLSVFGGLPTRGSQYLPEDVRVAPISPHICPHRTAIYILIQHP